MSIDKIFDDDTDVLDFIHDGADSNAINNSDMDDKNKDNYIYGIDLGTTNSCISIWRNNKIEIIPDENGRTTIPSVVAYTNLSQYVGYDAKNQKEINSDNVFYEVKRLIGRRYDDPVIRDEMELLSYQIVDDGRGGIGIQSTIMNNRVFTPEEISAQILIKLKSMAKRYMKTEHVKDVIITIPANFNDGQRQATKDAAVIAGLNPILLLNEPTAASLAYGMHNRSKVIKYHKDEKIDEDFMKILVYDFGGGTLDVSLLDICDGIFTVKASSGNTHFGGADFDERLMVYCLNRFKVKYGYTAMKFGDITGLSHQILRKQCENAKKILSTTTKTHIAVKNFYDGKNLLVPLTRDKFESICSDLFLMCLSPVQNILEDTDTEIEDIDEVILVGGMTRIPYIRKLIRTQFGKDGNCSVNPNEAISIGAAIQGYLKRFPSDPFSDNIGLIDVTSLSLGVELIGGVMDILVPRKTCLPCEMSKVFTTDKDDVDSVIVKIYEGERSMTKNNYFVGEFELGNIPPAPRGYPEIEVTFSIDTNGIISVTAKDLRTSESNSITVSGNKRRLTHEEINELVEMCRRQEYMDYIEKEKKVHHYCIYDLCQAILENITREECKLKDTDKDVIKKDIEEQYLWLNNTSYNDREIDELKEKEESLKERYGTLIIRGDMMNAKFENNNESTKDVQKTTLYGDDDDDEKEMNMTFEKIQDNVDEDDLGMEGMTDVERDELKETRNALITLCESIADIVGSDSFAISDDHKEELRNFINDAILWTYAHDKPTKIEYKIKIDEVDKACDTIMKAYEDKKEDIFIKNDIVDSNEYIVTELENLCISLKILIEQKSLPISNDTEIGRRDMNILETMITNNMEWIVNNIHTKKESDINEESIEKVAVEKLEILNTLCSDIYSRSVSNIFNENDNTNVIVTSEDADTTYNNTGGTSIMELMKARQDSGMNEKDNDENIDEDKFFNDMNEMNDENI
jgi:molecular chaperone DnaK (HSP70)